MPSRIYFLDATLASAFVARWCPIGRVEIAAGRLRWRPAKTVRGALFPCARGRTGAAGRGGPSSDAVTMPFSSCRGLSPSVAPLRVGVCRGFGRRGKLTVSLGSFFYNLCYTEMRVAEGAGYLPWLHMGLSCPTTLSASSYRALNFSNRVLSYLHQYGIA